MCTYYYPVSWAIMYYPISFSNMKSILCSYENIQCPNLLWKFWRLQEGDLWKKFCLTDYPDAWSSVSERGTLSWTDIYVNICLWTKISSAYVKRELLKCLTNLDKQIVTANVSKGKLLYFFVGTKISLIVDICFRRFSECYSKEFYKVIWHSDVKTYARNNWTALVIYIQWKKYFIYSVSVKP